jgi:hypothetical protein
MSHASVTRSSTGSARLLNGLLATGLLGMALALGGCGDSVTGQATKAAVTKGIAGSKLLASAGQARPTESLIESVPAPLDDAKLQSRINEAKRPDSKSDVQGGPDTLAADLKNSASMFSDALSAKTEGLDKSSQAFLNNGAGYVQLNQGLASLNAMFDAYASAMEQASQISHTTADLNVLATEAQTLQDSVANAGKAYDDKISAAQKALDDAKADADAKAKAAEQQKNEIDGLRQQASAQYDKSQKQIDAASQAHGMASIDAYNEGVKQRAIADDLASQVATKLPVLTEAQADSDVAARIAQEQQQQLDALQQSKKTLGAYVDAVNAQVASIQAEIKQKIDAPEIGLRAQVQAFATSSTAVQTQMQDALKTTNAAKASFKAAVDAYGSYSSQISGDATYTNKIDDPLLKAVKKPEVAALMKLNGAAASYQAAIVQLLASGVAQQQTALQANINAAYKSVGMSDTAPTPIGNPDEMKAAALSEIKDGAATLANAGATAPALPSTSPVAWLGYSLKAIAYQTLYDATRFDKAPDTDSKAEAATAAAEAKKRNPGLLLPGIGEG